MNPIVDRLTQARAGSGLSLREVARRSDVSPACVHSWEHGLRDPSLENLERWARVFDLELRLVEIAP